MFDKFHFLRKGLIFGLSGFVILILIILQVRYYIFLKTQYNFRNLASSNEIVKIMNSIKPNFIDNKNPQEKLMAIAQFCKSNGWQYSAFIQLMAPNTFSKEYNQINGYIVTEDRLKLGFGYWAVFQTQEMDMRFYQEYIDVLNQIWESV